MNHTAEPHNVIPFRSTKPPCGWCVSIHVSNIECRCEEPCSSSWCPRTIEGEDFRL